MPGGGKVKRSENGIIYDPVTLPPNGSVDEARKIMREQNISGIPIVVDNNELVGILTRRDLKFHEGNGNQRGQRRVDDQVEPGDRGRRMNVAGSGGADAEFGEGGKAVAH